jgi:tRNA (guanine9-N1)-methyltransferase
MEAHERPSKARKLSHDANNLPSTLCEASVEDMSPNATGDHEKLSDESKKRNHANNLSLESSFPKCPKDQVFGDEALELPCTGPSLAFSSQQHMGEMSKNQLKKLRKKEEWEAGREERRIMRKRKTQEKKSKKRATRDAAMEGAPLTNAEAIKNGQDMTNCSSLRPGIPKHASSLLLPITVIIDCAFDDLMHERERISLTSQITRSYSDNHRAPFKAHLVVSSWGGELRERFDTILSQHYKNWKGVRVLEDDFVDAAERAKEWMSSEKSQKLAGAFAIGAEHEAPTDLENKGEVVYLTSDSENTLDRLKPYSTYIVGGLVDKNRHKGVCYKSACGKGIRTAKLPIGEYMDMQSRYVLATNHVVEIIIRWLECGNWGEAFLKVIPKRKGGKLKHNSTDARRQDNDNETEEEAKELGDSASKQADENEGNPTASDCLRTGQSVDPI